MNITVFVPGLFATFKEISPADIDALSCPALSRLLARANKKADTSVNNDDWLYQRFNVAHDAGRSIPVAAITALQDGLDSKTGYWMRADPVYLQADTRSLILQDPAQLELRKDEVRSIADLIAPLFEDDGAKLLAPHSARCYLNFATHVPGISCTPLHAALAKPVNALLPQGEERRRWHTLFNEIQMLLNQSEINRQREARRLQPVNSLWFWGEGSFPGKLHSPYDLCVGDSAFLAGLCQATATSYLTANGRSCHTLLENKRERTEVLIADERCQHAVRLSNPALWLQALQKLEQETIAPLVGVLQQGEVKSITLHDGGITFDCSARQMRSFWKPQRSLSARLMP